MISSSSTTPRCFPPGSPSAASTGGAAEILLLEERGDGSWEALAKPSKKLEARQSTVSADGLVIEMGEDLGDGPPRRPSRSR